MHKTMKTNGFQNTQKPRQIMEKASLNLNSNTKHENEKQEHKICKNNYIYKITYENINMK
jgi:hypothetical protein